MLKVSYYILGDLIKNRVILGYVVLLASISWGVFMIEGEPEKAFLVMMQVILLALPLITMVFATIYYYNSLEFIALVLAQPISRATVIGSIYCGLSVAFVLGFLIGMGLPLLVFYPTVESLLLIGTALLLSLTFIAIALFISTLISDKARGMGITLLIWSFIAFLYDGFLLLIIYQFGDYPIEKALLSLILLNPVDIARITIIMKTEASAMMGLTGAIFREFFGGSLGLMVSMGALVVWAIVPFKLAARRFRKKDI